MGKKKEHQRDIILKRLAESKIIENEEIFPGQTLSDKIQNYYEGQVLSAMALNDVGDRYLGLMEIKRQLSAHIEDIKALVSKKLNLQNWKIGGGGLAAGAGVGLGVSLLTPVLPVAIFFGLLIFGATIGAAADSEGERLKDIKKKFEDEKNMLQDLKNEIKEDMQQIKSSVSDEELMQSARRDILRQTPDFKKRLNAAFKKALRDDKNKPDGNKNKPSAPLL